MKILYQNEKLEKQCSSIKEAKRIFGGDNSLAISLLARINAIEQAENLRDIIVQPAFHFHNLHNNGKKNREGTYAIDVKSRREPWRIILEPLDENEQPYVSETIDEISGTVRVVMIQEVSKHYE